MAKKKVDLEKLYDKDPEGHKMHTFKSKWGPKKTAKKKKSSCEHLWGGSNEPDHYRQDPSDVSFWWRCKCHKRNRPEAWSYLDLAARGSPVCPRCGEDMMLEMP